MVSLPTQHLATEYDEEQPIVQKQRSQSGITLVLVIIIIVLFGLLLTSNWDKVTPYFSTGTSGSEAITGSLSGDFFVGKEIGLSGTLLQQGDFTSYTHTLILNDGQLLGLKSTTLALAQYSGDVIIGGAVVDFVDGVYIVEVNTIIPVPKEIVAEITGDIEKIENKELTGITYIPEAGILVDERILGGTKAKSDDFNKKLTLEGTDGQTITISYFMCTKATADEDCASLQKTFRDAGAELVRTSSNGDEFREMPETTSIFGSIDERRGYYLQTSNKSFLTNTLNSITFLDAKAIRALFDTSATKLCRIDGGTLETIDDITTTTVDNGDILAVIKGKTSDQDLVTCRITIDPTYELGGTFLDMQIKTIDPTTSMTTGTTAETTAMQPTTPTTLQKDPTVSQVPTSTTKTYTHTGKDYTIVFPSTNLRYDRVPVTGDMTLGYPGLSCHGKFHVIAYEKDATIRDTKMLNEPKAMIYACTDNETLAQTVSSSFVVTRQLDKKRMFLAQPLDPSRYDFVIQTVISETGTGN